MHIIFFKLPKCCCTKWAISQKSISKMLTSFSGQKKVMATFHSRYWCALNCCTVHDQNTCWHTVTEHLLFSCVWTRASRSSELAGVAALGRLITLFCLIDPQCRRELKEPRVRTQYRSWRNACSTSALCAACTCSAYNDRIAYFCQHVGHSRVHAAWNSVSHNAIHWYELTGSNISLNLTSLSSC